MHALVIFESMFGNTRDVAQAIVDGLGSRYDVDVIEVGRAPAVIPPDIDLAVIGGPTHAFGMTRESTRQDAGRRAPAGVISAGSGLREWLAALRLPSQLAVAVFDTRIDKPRVPGSAAKAAGKRLRRLGARIIADPESFYVDDVQGPLIDGELERAREWGRQLASTTSQTAATPVP